MKTRFRNTLVPLLGIYMPVAASDLQALDIEYNGDALFTLDISTNLPAPVRWVREMWFAMTAMRTRSSSMEPRTACRRAAESTRSATRPMATC